MTPAGRGAAGEGDGARLGAPQLVVIQSASLRTLPRPLQTLPLLVGMPRRRRQLSGGEKRVPLLCRPPAPAASSRAARHFEFRPAAALRNVHVFSTRPGVAAILMYIVPPLRRLFRLCCHRGWSTQPIQQHRLDRRESVCLRQHLRWRTTGGLLIPLGLARRAAGQQYLASSRAIAQRRGPRRFPAGGHARQGRALAR